MVLGSGIPNPGIPGIVTWGGESNVATPWASPGITPAGGVGRLPAALAIGAAGIRPGSPGTAAAAGAAGAPGTKTGGVGGVPAVWIAGAPGTAAPGFGTPPPPPAAGTPGTTAGGVPGVATGTAAAPPGTAAPGVGTPGTPPPAGTPGTAAPGAGGVTTGTPAAPPGTAAPGVGTPGKPPPDKPPIDRTGFSDPGDDDFRPLDDGRKVPFARSDVGEPSFEHFKGDATGGGHDADSSVPRASKFPAVVQTAEDLQLIQDTVLDGYTLARYDVRNRSYVFRGFVNFKGNRMVVDAVFDPYGTSKTIYPVNGDLVHRKTD